MNTLSVWRFDTPDGAETALRAVERLQHRRVVTIDDASVVAWPAGARRPRTYQAGTAAGTAALSGAFWGLLFGLLFLLPLAGPEAGPATALACVGLPDEVLRRIRDRVTPGTSALFLLSHDGVPDRVREVLEGMHAEVLVSTLDRDQEAALRRAFDIDTGVDAGATP
ncbi:DUF1269 domain-containing protein [Pseudonocardia sp.]|uniref:DUF1269 domain-containing protein n=1 Tax=Pseudonocardia sp. TaxID=60912 RepID=UPI003D0EDCD5